MAWNDDLLEEQEAAAGHTGTHARLLAGPGTGKTLTLTRHISFLVDQKKVPPDTIRAFTFTRAAANELDERVTSVLGKENNPRVSTLHSFALHQLLKNEASISTLPKPLRIADDWEERHIVQEDLKAMLELKSVSDARRLLNELSADWQSLTADDSDWEQKFPNAPFLGAWREHRQLYGYTLRSELVYQLKKALEQRSDFQLESPISHLLVDEYQDLNRCDLAVVQYIESRGVELFIAGDDDQSIYGFRKAHPEGIRRFDQDFSNVSTLSLEVCKRCDQEILATALFVAKQDHRRIEKTVYPDPEAGKGEVALLRFNNQYGEATGIANLCRRLLTEHSLEPSNILILLRADHNGIFPQQISQKLTQAGIPVATATYSANAFDTPSGRSMLGFLQLAVREDDSLAWRALLDTWCKGIGSGAIEAVYNIAREKGWTFAGSLQEVRSDPSLLPTTYRSRLPKAIDDVVNQLEASFPEAAREPQESYEALRHIIQKAAGAIIVNEGEREAVLAKLDQTGQSASVTSIVEVVRVIGAGNEDIEQEIEPNKVNILTMHRAKGLTAEAVIIAAAEDEYIPGYAKGEEIEDERRLLYVSLTRARHHLFITYCNKRTGQQMHSGRTSGTMERQLSQFLADCPHSPQDGNSYISAPTKLTTE